MAVYKVNHRTNKWVKMESILEEYEIEAENVIVTAEIIKYGTRPVKYKLILQDIGLGTEALLNQIRQELVLDVDISTAEILDPKVIDYSPWEYVAAKISSFEKNPLKKGKPEIASVPAKKVQ